jgi:hypothetical protein
VAAHSARVDRHELALVGLDCDVPAHALRCRQLKGHA